MNRRSLAPFYRVAIFIISTAIFAACDRGANPNDTAASVIDSTGPPCADCIVRGSAPAASTFRKGDYRYAAYPLPAAAYPAGATVYYPIDAEPPFAGLVYCPGHGATEDSMAAWGPFFASHGIVLVTMNTSDPEDDVDTRDDEQRQALGALKAEHRRAASPLCGRLSGRFGLMGWSMGGGATWINAAKIPDLKSAMSVAGHNMTASSAADGTAIQCPTLILNGAGDNTPLGGWGQSTGVYEAIDKSISKIVYEVRNVGHFKWYSPTSAGREVAELALAFQKTFLEGDLRWAKFLIDPPRNAAVWETNIVVE